MELEQKIDRLVNNVLALAGQVEKRAKHAEFMAEEAERKLEAAANGLEKSSGKVREAAEEAVSKGLRQSTNQYVERLETTGRWLLETSREVEARQQKSAKDLKKLVWVSVGVSLLTAVFCLGVMVYMIQSSRAEIRRTEWVADINKAVDGGKLVQCGADGGVCAKVGKKLVRLDR